MSVRSRGRRRLRARMPVQRRLLQRNVSNVASREPAAAVNIARRLASLAYDGRLFHPDPERLRFVDGRVVARGQVKPVAFGDLNALMFHRPERLAVCVRRRRRRQVLFAFRRTRSGRGSSRRRGLWSDVRC